MLEGASSAFPGNLSFLSLLFLELAVKEHLISLISSIQAIIRINRSVLLNVAVVLVYSTHILSIINTG